VDFGVSVRFRQVSEPCKDFINSLLVPYAHDRPSATEALEHAWFVNPLPTMPAMEPLEQRLQDRMPPIVVSSNQPEARQSRPRASLNFESPRVSPRSKVSQSGEFSKHDSGAGLHGTFTGDELCAAKALSDLERISEEREQRLTREQMLEKLRATKGLQAFQVPNADPPLMAQVSTNRSIPASGTESANTSPLPHTGEHQHQVQPPQKGRDSWSFWSRTPRSPKAVSSRGWSLGLWTPRQRPEPTEERRSASAVRVAWNNSRNNSKSSHQNAGDTSETMLTSRDGVQIAEQIPGETCGRWGVPVSSGTSSIASSAESGRHRKRTTTWQSTSTSASTMAREAT